MFFITTYQKAIFILLDKNNLTSDELILLEKEGLNALDETLKQHETVTEAYAKIRL